MNCRKDIRTLCYRCASDYREAGYELFIRDTRLKNKCCKCERMGFDYEVQFKKQN